MSNDLKFDIWILKRFVIVNLLNSKCVVACCGLSQNVISWFSRCQFNCHRRKFMQSYTKLFTQISIRKISAPENRPQRCQWFVLSFQRFFKNLIASVSDGIANWNCQSVFSIWFFYDTPRSLQFCMRKNKFRNNSGKLFTVLIFHKTQHCTFVQNFTTIYLRPTQINWP